MSGNVSTGTAVGALLRSERMAMGFTQTDVAKHLGISQAALSNYERGKRPNIPVGVAWEWSVLLGLSIEGVLKQAARRRWEAAA